MMSQKLQVIFLTEFLSTTYVPVRDSSLYHRQLHGSCSMRFDPVKESVALIYNAMLNILPKLGRLKKNCYAN
jgi:hypothetical protein